MAVLLLLIMSICGCAGLKAGRPSRTFDDDIYETLKRDMEHSKEGLYDNVPGGEALVHYGAWSVG